MLETLNEKIANKTIHAGIIGLGYVGLPLIRAMCANGVKATGFDIDKTKIEKLMAGQSYLETVSSDDIKTFLDSGLFEATGDFTQLGTPDVLVICVPTPLDEHREPDLSYVEKTTEAIAETLRPGQMIALESTTYPGTSSVLIKPLLEKTGLTEGEDFFLIYSPEREDPGNQSFKTATTPKVVGADDPGILKTACAFYNLFVSQTVPVSSLDTAEAVKITENVFRAVNIALVNELKVIYEKMGIDIWEVIDAAKTKPFGFMPFYPGPGLGGHCIPIDPFYLTWRAREFGMTTRFIELAGEINTNMPNYVVEKTAQALNAHSGKALKGAKILILGLAYKKNVNDQRESPAFPIMKSLAQSGADVSYHDPYVPEVMPSRHYPQTAGKQSVEINAEALSTYDAALIVTDHDNVDYDLIATHCPLVIDTRNALKGGNGTIVKA